jgi:hypothetical protein
VRSDPDRSTPDHFKFVTGSIQQIHFMNAPALPGYTLPTRSIWWFPASKDGLKQEPSALSSGVRQKF